MNKLPITKGRSLRARIELVIEAIGTVSPLMQEFQF
jgi:hypothetical protein